MKRIVIVLLVVFMLFSLVSCRDQAAESTCAACGSALEESAPVCGACGATVGGDSSFSTTKDTDTTVSATAAPTDPTDTTAVATPSSTDSTTASKDPTTKTSTTSATEAKPTPSVTTKQTTTEAVTTTKPTPSVTTEQTTTEAVTTTKPTEVDSFDYLAIGNSITQHGTCDYWWNNIGMAASRPEKDYFHLVTSYLKQCHRTVNAKAVNFSAWEILSTDRTQTIVALDNYLSENLDLITIQLSENVTDRSTFVVDMKELITILQQRCPKATIILVDDFWSDEMACLKKQIAADKQIPFASLEGIRGGAPYVCGLGTIVYDRFNNPHEVQHSGVAAHPGDKGMQAIADAIIGCLAQE